MQVCVAVYQPKRNSVSSTSMSFESVAQWIGRTVRCSAVHAFTGEKQGTPAMTQFAQPGQGSNRRTTEFGNLLLLLLVWLFTRIHVRPHADMNRPARR